MARLLSLVALTFSIRFLLKRLLHGAEQETTFEWLGQKRDGLQLRGFSSGRGRIVGGDENHGISSASLDQTALKVESRHSWEANVDDKTTDVHRRTRIEEVLGRAIPSSLETRGSEHPLQRLSHSGVVLHDRDPFLSSRDHRAAGSIHRSSGGRRPFGKGTIVLWCNAPAGAQSDGVCPGVRWRIGGAADAGSPVR
jgi:hypothetical protein